MKKTTLPSLNSLRYFDAAARHCSFSLAAEELCVTPAAVSYQIRLLESELGISLFKRLARIVVLTESGATFLGHVQTALSALAEGVREVTVQQQSGPLNVSLVPSFAQQWLLPRLDRFNARYPDVQLRINASSRLANFDLDGNHMAVRLGNGKWGPDLIVEDLLEERVFPVCCPDFAAKYQITTPKDLLRLPLLHNDFYTWEAWFRALGESVEQIPKGPVFDDANLLVMASLRGMGVCLIRTSVAQTFLGNARLIRPVAAEVLADKSYFLVFPERHQHHAGVMAFREWIHEEAGNCIKQKCPFSTEAT